MNKNQVFDPTEPDKLYNANQYSIPQTFQVQPEEETPIYRNQFSNTMGLTDHIRKYPHLTTMQAVTLEIAIRHPDNLYLGTRKKFENGTLGDYQFRTYSDIHKISRALGSAIWKQNFAPYSEEEDTNEKLRFIAVFSRNRAEWVELDIASYLYGLTMVPLYESFDGKILEHVFTQTGTKTCFCSADHLELLINLPKTRNFDTIICFDPLDLDIKEKAKSKGYLLMHYGELLAFGETLLNFPTVRPNDILTLCYTSGTTGLPKAVKITHQNMLSMIGAIDEKKDISIDSTDIYLSYLPLAHSMERVIVAYLGWKGSRIGFFSGDAKKISEDCKILKPTIMATVPKVLKTFYEKIWANINDRVFISKKLITFAIDTKLKNLTNSQEYTHALYDTLFFRKIRDIIGGHVKFMITGSAPIDKEILQFLRIAFCCPIVECYGQTETSSCGFMTRTLDTTTGHIGGPLNCIEFKLIDVPEMNYSIKNVDEKGKLLPQGEILVRGPSIFTGYYRDEKKTKETLDKDGWLHSGDIGQVNLDGSVSVIDREKDIFKLSQGEYIAPEKIETIYLRSNLVKEVFVYGESQQDHLVGVVVPDKEAIEVVAKELGISGIEYEEMCGTHKLREKMLQIMNEVGRKGGLHNFELAKKIHLEPKSFGELELLNPAMKLKRFQAKEHYKSVLENLYK